MLTSAEVEGVKAILRLLNLEKLLAVAKTTTKNFIKFETSEDAVNAVVTYTEKPSDFLRRKNIEKQDIFNYLRSIGTFVSVNGAKKDYIMACLKLWQSMECVQAGDMLEDQEDAVQDFKAIETYCMTVHQQQCTLLMPEIVDKLSTDFLSWFFQSLNRLDNFGPHHFWPDCKLTVRVIHPNNVAENYYHNANSVAKAFTEFVQKEGLFFHPNISKEAVKYEQEQHGLIKVAVSGVIHNSNNCVGIFDFGFGLVQDPHLDNNWKIKFVQCQLRVTAGESVPPIEYYAGNSSMQMISL